MDTSANSLETRALAPYKSLLVAQLRPQRYRSSILAAVWDGIAALVEATNIARIVDRSEWTEAGNDLMALYYREERQSPWSTQPGVVDNLGQLVLGLRRKQLVAVHCSDPRIRDRILSAITNSTDAFATLAPIGAGRLNKAFVSGSRPRTMWLAGIHRRTSVKADGKVLSGIDLRDALDPLEDQSYQFSAIRCNSNLTAVPIGVSPRRSRLWAGTSSDWTDFRRATEQILDHLAATAGVDATPLPILASSEPGTPSGPFDVALLPDDLFGSDPDLDVAARNEMEAIADHALLDLTSHQGASFETRVSLAGYEVGDLTFDVDASDPERVSVRVDGSARGRETEDVFKTIRAHARRKSWLKVRYDSGHTISDGALFSMRYRDLPFPGFAWANFRDFVVTQEKPSHLSNTGDQRSLFCWVQNFWPFVAAETTADRGWLACDDGAMEIADFIHLDSSVTPPRLSLIHVKAAKSDAEARGVSVSPFEIVTSQAVKNIRHLDQVLLADGLRDGLGKQISTLVWEDGNPSTRASMIDALSNIGSDYTRQTVVLQPQITRGAVTRARARPRSQDAARLRQLDALLGGAAAACRNVSSGFIVVGDAQRAENVTRPALTA